MSSNAQTGQYRTIDHSAKVDTTLEISIPSYQHGKPYMLPEKKLPSSIKLPKQHLINLTRGSNNIIIRNANPATIDLYTTNLAYEIKKINDNVSK